MPLNPLALSIATGVQDRAFRSIISGQTAGTVIELTDASTPGFGYANGIVSHPALPYDLNAVELRERVPGGEVRVSRLLVSGVTGPAVKAAAIAGGR